jgi:hypothetical protein
LLALDGKLLASYPTYLPCDFRRSDMRNRWLSAVFVSIAAILATLVSSSSEYAQELLPSGTGAMNLSMGSASTAMGVRALGAL